jgi:alpha-tubulin suppressor-like RCC1 family protein
MSQKSLLVKWILLLGLLCLVTDSFAVRYTNDYNYTWTYAQSASVPIGSIKVPMTQLQLQLISSTGTGTYTLISLSFNTSGTTNLADISSARLWYNTANNLNTATQLGSTITSITGILTFTINQVRNSAGPFYYWLTYDISSSASAGNYVASLLQSIVNTDYLHPSPFSWTPGMNYQSNSLLICATSVAAPATPSLSSLSMFTKPTMGTWMMSTGVSIVRQPNGLVYTAGSDQDGEFGDGVVGSPNMSNNLWIQNTNSNITGIIQVDNGINTNIVLKNNGTVWGWGDNWWGKIGDGTSSSTQPTPQQTRKSAAAGGGFLTNVVKVMSGYNCTVALTADHKVYAWGNNSSGQFGPSYALYSYHPFAELLTYDGTNPINWAVDVDCGDDFIAILRWNGTVWVMGNGSYGQLGNGNGGVGYSSTTPVGAYAPGVCTSLQHIKCISAGRRFMLAVDSSGNAYGWGLNNYGQTGTGGAGTDVYQPKKILGPGCSGFLTDIVQVVAAGDAGYALSASGNLFSWGSDQNEELGDGPGGINRQCPQQVYSNVAEVAAGLYAVLVRKTDGTVCAAGNNWMGNFGLGGPWGCCSYVNVFTCTSLGVGLPVELLSFTGKSLSNSILLEWSTASEINNDYFTIEKSRDGIAFSELGKINGAGNSTQLNSYSLIDENPFSGTNYYRLKQTDFDGKYSYSEIIAVKLFSSPHDIFLFPNPAAHYSSVNFYLDNIEQVQIDLFDITGRKIKELFNGNLLAGKQEIKIDIGNIENGIYRLTLSGTRINKSIDLIKCDK